MMFLNPQRSRTRFFFLFSFYLIFYLIDVVCLINLLIWQIELALGLLTYFFTTWFGLWFFVLEIYYFNVAVAWFLHRLIGNLYLFYGFWIFGLCMTNTGSTSKFKYAHCNRLFIFAIYFQLKIFFKFLF